MSNCPHPTTRASGICRQCSVERQFEHLKAQDDYRDCPECGQPTSYLEGACYRCRGAGQECERCGTKDADLTRRPVHELDEPMTMCPDCMRHLDRCGRLQVAMTDGGVREHDIQVEAQYTTDSIEDLHELLQRAEQYHGEWGQPTIAMEFADAADFVGAELVEDDPEVSADE